jgi:hypothetical protein
VNGDEAWTPARHRLRGQRVAICAFSPYEHSVGRESVEETYRSSRILETEEAVVSYLRAMLANGAEVTLLADEPLALLAGVVAGEYVEPFLEEQNERPAPQLTIVAETIEEGADPLQQFEALGYARVQRRSSPSDEIDRDTRAILLAGNIREVDVERLRERAPNATLFAIASSGVYVQSESVRYIDVQVREEHPLRAQRQSPLDRAMAEEPEPAWEFEYPPIVLAAQLIAQQLADENEQPFRVR